MVPLGIRARRRVSLDALLRGRRSLQIWTAGVGPRERIDGSALRDMRTGQYRSVFIGVVYWKRQW